MHNLRVLLSITASGARWLLLGAWLGAAGLRAGTVANLLRPELPRLERQIAELRQQIQGLPQLSLGHAGARRGFHGTYTPIINKPYAVTIDLGRTFPIDAVVVVPAHSVEGSSVISGYGFPRRFRIDVSDDPDLKSSRTVADETARDFPNPGAYPYFARAAGVSGRYVRILATQRWLQSERMWMVAYAEVIVLSGGSNVASGSRVIAPGHRVQHPPVWMDEDLVDGQTDVGLPVSQEPSRSNGYESARSPIADAVKWVQVDLGQSVPIDEIRLVPAHPPDYPAPGYGFPLHFRIEGAADKNFRTPEILADYTSQDFVNPGDNIVTVRADGRRSRFVRVTATRLSDDFGPHRYSFALAELEVISKGRNAALHQPVTALDAQDDPRQPWQIEAFPEGPRWGLQYLTDGYASRNRLMDPAAWLEGLAKRGQLTRRLENLEARYTALQEQAAGLTVVLGTAVTLILGAGTGFLMWWSRRRRAAQIRELRRRLARDLHDEIGSSLGSIRLNSQIARNAPGVPASAREDLETIEQVAAETADSMRDIIWLLDGGNVTAAELVSQMKLVAERLLADHDYSIRVQPASARELALDFRRNVLFAFKEALYNAVRHSGAGCIEIESDAGQKGFEFRVRDNGRGFDPGKLEDGHGLQNLRSRASSLRGRASIESAIGRGTLVYFRVPVA
jgi:signal transduction histidine kinase